MCHERYIYIAKGEYVCRTRKTCVVRGVFCRKRCISVVEDEYVCHRRWMNALEGDLFS